MIVGRARRWVALVGVTLVATTGCQGDDGDDATDVATPATSTPGATGAVDPEAGVEVPEPDDNSGGDETQPSVVASTEPTMPAAPQGAPLVDELPLIELLGPPESGAGVAPQFSWGAVEGAAAYRLAVLGPDGPIWAWTGEATEVFLGGLDFEQPPGWAGPQIVDGTCWSVAARDASGDVIAVSGFVPVSPGEPAGHECLPPGT